jgi:Cu+-exporting ATPase
MVVMVRLYFRSLLVVPNSNSRTTIMSKQPIDTQTSCFHCGEDCGSRAIIANDKSFCCEGCKMVFEIINQSGLCDYYAISKNPGNSQKIRVRKDKFSFLDDEKIWRSLISFSNDKQTHVTFYLPQIHCSSCLWLLENLHRLNENIISSKVNFPRKETYIIFNEKETSLRQVAELLTAIGYEPYISFNDLNHAKPTVNKSKIYKLGIAGFCFANIMLLSFPEYLGIDVREQELVGLFRYLNLVLSLPVVFFSATGFYNSSRKSQKHGVLNI